MDIYMGSFFFRVKNNDCYEERRIKGLKTYYTISFRFIVYGENEICLNEISRLV